MIFVGEPSGAPVGGGASVAAHAGTDDDADESGRRAAQHGTKAGAADRTQRAAYHFVERVMSHCFDLHSFELRLCARQPSTSKHSNVCAHRWHDNRSAVRRRLPVS